MSINGNSNYSRLDVIINERGRRILERFRSTIFSGVHNPELRLILNGVKLYWGDVYRPALISFSCEAVGGKQRTADDASLMISLAAAGIGIHDDIIDKSLKKHFKNTLIDHIGPEKTMIIGDLLLVKGWAKIQEMIEKTCYSKKIVDVLKAYEKSSIKMCEAELEEISCRKNLDTNIEDYTGEILLNLNADLEGCTKIGAILGNGSNNEINALARFGRYLGFMLALKNEVSDTLNFEANLLHRLANESVPLPILYSAKSSKENKAIVKSILQKSPITEVDLKELLIICFESKAFNYIQNIAEKNTRQATKSLGTLQPSNARTVLTQMINDVNKKVIAMSNYVGSYNENIEKQR